MMSFALLTIVKATLACGVALAVLQRVARARASTRHLICALAFAALVAIPVAASLLPTIVVTVPAAATRRLQPDVMLPVAWNPDSTNAIASPLSQAGTTRAFTPAQLLSLVWLTGTLLFAAPVVIGFWQLRRLRRTVTHWSARHVLLETHSLTDLCRNVEVTLHAAVTSPITAGILSPLIVLPAAAQKWDRPTLRCALTHELEHVRRHDFLLQCAARIVCAAYWFHPLVWALWRRLRLEAERACDDAVLVENDARDYATLLVALARHGAALERGVVAMAGRDDLAARIAAVLDRHQTRGRTGRRPAIQLTAAAMMIVCGVGPMTIARATPQSPGTSIPLRRFETVTLKRSLGVDNPLMYVTPFAGGTPGVGPDGRVQWVAATNVTARNLLWFAYGPELRSAHRPARVPQIENEPAWLDSDRFDLVAKAPAPASSDEMMEMLRGFLADRFKMVAHVGTKEFPAYALIRSSSDGRLGPRMVPTQIGDCRSSSITCGLSGTGGRLTGRGITIAQLIRVLPNHLGGASHIVIDRPVLNQTDLDGAFDFTLEWTPDPVPPDVRAPSAAAPWLPLYRPFAFPLESHAPNFLAALEEQLGLRLEHQLAPDPVLVIDRIELPVAN